MKRFQVKSRREPVHRGARRVFYSWPAVALLALLVFFLGSRMAAVYLRWEKARDERDRAELRLTREKERQTELAEDIARLKTERGFEQEVRTNLNLAKPGEGVIILVGTSTGR